MQIFIPIGAGFTSIPHPEGTLCPISSKNEETKAKKWVEQKECAARARNAFRGTFLNHTAKLRNF